MAPKEKAEEVVRKYYSFGLNNPAQSFSWYECKQCALIAVDEVIENLVDLSNVEFVFIYQVDYWKEVQQEIEKL